MVGAKKLLLFPVYIIRQIPVYIYTHRIMMNRPFTNNDSGAADSNTTVLSTIDHNLQEKTMNKDVEKNDPSWDLRRVDSCE